MARPLARMTAALVAGGTALAVCLLALPPAVGVFTGGAKYEGVVGDDLAALSERTVITDNRGRVIGELGLQDRSSVRLSDVSPVLIAAVLNTEDRNFYENAGVDVQAVARAFFRNVDSGGVSQGGSTITQQLVKNRLFASPQRTLSRKVREAALALRLDAEWPKNRILEEYLNTVYFGQGSYGIRSAAERFFQTQPSRLDVAQSALLAGLIHNPEGDNPFTHPDEALARRATVLRSMREQGLITEAEEQYARVVPLPTTKPAADLRPKNYYVDEVQRRLLDDPRLAPTARERYNLVFRGGLKVTTAYDQRMQDEAQAAVTKTLPATQFTAAMAVMDPTNGEVKALVAGPGFERSQFNLATQGARQPGSTYKAITLAAALEAGYSAKDTISGGSPCTVKIDGYQPWTTRNAEGGGGSYSLRTATEESVNCAYARLIAAVGPAKVAAMAKRMGITREPPAYPSITLGTVGASPLEMATVYSTLAAEGVRHDPVFVTKVLDRDGRVIFDTAPRAKRVLDVEIARTETDILTGVIRNGTGTRANIGRPAAGKTGTTDDKTNAWFVGYTPQLVAAVWMGDPAAYTPMKNVGRFGEVFGGTYPAVIWHEFMVAALRNQPVKKFTAPDQTLWPKPASITDKGRGVPWSSFTGATGSTGVTGPTGPSGPSGPTGETPGTSTTTVPEVTTTTVAPPPTTVASIGRVTGPR